MGKIILGSFDFQSAGPKNIKTKSMRSEDWIQRRYHMFEDLSEVVAYDF